MTKPALPHASLLELQDCEDRDADCDDDGNISTQTELTGNTVQAMQEEIQRLLSEHIALKEKLLRANL